MATVVTPFGAGVKTCERATSVQQIGGWVEKKSRTERSTTTCIGPVTCPMRTLTAVTVPATGATNVFACGFSADPAAIHVQVPAPLGTTVKPGWKPGGGSGSTVQSMFVLGGRLRSVPNGTAPAAGVEERRAQQRQYDHGRDPSRHAATLQLPERRAGNVCPRARWAGFNVWLRRLPRYRTSPSATPARSRSSGSVSS